MMLMPYSSSVLSRRLGTQQETRSFQPAPCINRRCALFQPQQVLESIDGNELFEPSLGLGRNIWVETTLLCLSSVEHLAWERDS